jgi:hypothetical protein
VLPNGTVVSAPGDRISPRPARVLRCSQMRRVNVICRRWWRSS